VRGDEAPELRFSYELRETSRLLLGALKSRIVAHDLTLSQYFLLRQLWEEEGISQTALSARLQTTNPATVATVDSLAARGLLKRVRSDVDRRVARIFLTAKGRALRREVLAYARELSNAAVAGMSGRDVAKLRSLLAVVRENLAALEGNEAAEAGR
jgi:DNA-binding MarR family transcriptional regulator